MAVLSIEARASVVEDGNRAAIETFEAAKFSPIAATRGLAILQAAVFDAVNACEPRYAPYLYRGPAPAGASAKAAGIEAAYRVLAALAPSQTDALAVKSAAALAAVADPKARSLGVEVGDAAAKAVLDARSDDGFDDGFDPPPGPGGPGVYQPTSPGAKFPGRFPKMRPFGLTAASQFRLPPPPPLDSPQFVRDLLEVRAKGDARATPSPEHDAIAVFHAKAGFRPWNEIARNASEAHKLDLVDAARLFALLNFALSDSFEASFESKNAYAFWRPQTAIQLGGKDFGHAEIAADPGWKSVIPAPPFAEYPCMHCAIGAAGQRVLETLLPDSPAFSVGGEKGRRFRGFRDYAEEEAESRVLGGVHFRWSVVAGEAQGRLVADEDLKLLAPVR